MTSLEVLESIVGQMEILRSKSLALHKTSPRRVRSQKVSEVSRMVSVQLVGASLAELAGTLRLSLQPFSQVRTFDHPRFFECLA